MTKQELRKQLRAIKKNHGHMVEIEGFGRVSACPTGYMHQVGYNKDTRGYFYAERDVLEYAERYYGIK